MSAEPHGAAGDRPDAGRRPRLGDERMVRQERSEVRAHPDRPDAWTSASVRDAERLVQVQMRDVGAELARASEPDHRIEVGAIEVHLPTGLVDERAHFGDLILEHPVGGRVGDHQRAEAGAIRVDLGAQVVEIDVAPLVARDDDDLEPRHHRTRRVRAVRGCRDETHRAAVVAAAAGDTRGWRAAPRTRPASLRSAATRPSRSP